MRISSNKSDPGPGKKVQVSGRRYKNQAEADKQKRDEGKDTPFQKSLRDAESRNLKEFHWSDKEKRASDKPFAGSRPIATTSHRSAPQPEPRKPVVLPHADPKVKGTPSGSIPSAPGHKITVNKQKNEHGSRSHGVVKNNVLRKLQKAVNPSKFGAESNHGKNININRSKTYRDGGKAKVKNYTIALGGDKDKSITVSKLKPKQVIKAAKEKGYLK